MARVFCWSHHMVCFSCRGVWVEVEFSALVRRCQRRRPGGAACKPAQALRTNSRKKAAHCGQTEETDEWETR
ncbi:hypothetical protein BDN70DRAFT_205249 [Pholiota conissans]|uniref:Uncharacterized protein n=1 Tax=Pholiota conissans TaxID=109636 RepID=A0A9P5YXP8_9AGAR|nr:hypothetical protein BDN70DRAFT_205249 [Pholiota conissans]